MSAGLLHEFACYPGLMRALLSHKTVIRPLRVSYGIGKDQYFLHFAPPGKALDKVVVYLHGGGWNSGSPAQFPFVGQCFALAGYHCILIGYRKAPEHPFPAQMEDVCAGYRTALSYLEMMGIPAGKVAVVGSSAGAQLGALLCYDQEVHRRFAADPGPICAFVGLGGPYRFDHDPPLSLRTLTKKLLPPQGNPTPAQPYYRLGSAVKTPMLIIHSRRDGVVGWNCGADFFARAKALGIPAQLYIVRSRGDAHSAYSAGIFLEKRKDCPTLDHLLSWLEGL